MLNVTEFWMIAPMKLPRMRPARGLWRISLRGMMGRATRASTQMKRGKQMPKMTSDVTTKG
jgi:hypothetical protein